MAAEGGRARRSGGLRTPAEGRGKAVPNRTVSSRSDGERRLAKRRGVGSKSKKPWRLGHGSHLQATGAEGETRTPTGEPPLRPERSASTSSATSAAVMF